MSLAQTLNRSLAETLARLDAAVRPLTMNLPAKATVSLYSRMRKPFMHRFFHEQPAAWQPPPEYAQTLWGISFRLPLFNAAGMFKNGEGYAVVAAQGAGAYMAGTTTAIARMGNSKKGIEHPFAPYPHSAAASNWLGLPNRGHAAVASILSHISKVPGCPVGASLSSEPTQQGREALQSLVEGLKQYEQAGVDFLELNESCPNVVADGHTPLKDKLDTALVERLEYVHRHFLQQRQRPIPLIVKLSNDTDPALVPALVDILTSLGFGGVNFGNTSTRYALHRSKLDARDTRVFDYFTTTFGGGLSGSILKQDSLLLAGEAARYIPQNLREEFHVIRTGGVEQWQDVQQAQQQGIALCQWYTGYFEQFAHHGHQVYKKIIEG